MPTLVIVSELNLTVGHLAVPVSRELEIWLLVWKSYAAGVRSVLWIEVDCSRAGVTLLAYGPGSVWGLLLTALGPRSKWGEGRQMAPHGPDLTPSLKIASVAGV